MRHLIPLLAAGVLIPSLAAPSARAQPLSTVQVPAKRDPSFGLAELVERGTELRDQSHCAEAVATLEGAWAIEKTATTATLLGECEVKLRRWVPAATHLRFVLDNLEDGPERQRLWPLFNEARAQVGGVRIVTSVLGADVFAADRIVATTPLRNEVFLAPGEVTITVKKTTMSDMQKVVRVARGGSATALLDPAADARAVELVERGTELRDQGHWEEAVTTLEGAWAIEKTATTATLLGEWTATLLGECEVKLRRWVPAATHLSFVLRKLGDGPERQRIQLLFNEAREQVGGVRIVTSVLGADIFADNRIIARTPFPDEVFLAPGEVTISVKKTTMSDMQKVVRVARGGSATVSLNPAGAASNPKEAPKTRARVPIYLFTGAAAAVAATTGIALRVVGAHEGTRADAALVQLQSTFGPAPCSRGANVDCLSIKYMRSRQEAFTNVSTGFFVFGGAALAASVTYALWPTRSTGEGPAVTVAPAVSLSTGGVLVQGSF